MASVLVCDDDASVRHLVSVALTTDGHDMAEAADGAEALRLIDVAAPDVVILDIRMPKLDGFDVLEHLQTRADRADFGVVLLTGSVAEDDISRAWALGAEAYIGKPFDPADLRRVVSDMAHQRAAPPADG